jgi:hypothetical protein
MPNNLEYSTGFQTVLDETIVAQSTSGWMEGNAGQVIYNGGREIKIPVIGTAGLANYDREKGFKEGSVSLTYETKSMTMDRGRTFLLDAMDVNETNFVVTASNVLASFQREKVAPEIDAYRYSKIAQMAIDKDKISVAVITEANVLTQLNNDMYAILDKVGEGAQLVISMSTAVAKILDNSEKLLKKLDVTNFTTGAITTKVKMYNDSPVLRVPSSRMYSKYQFLDADTSTDTAGFAKANDAVAINWIISARTTPIAISKTDKVRVFEPNANIKADAWKVDYRKYHDLWITDNKMDTVRVSLAATPTTTPEE